LPKDPASDQAMTLACSVAARFDANAKESKMRKVIVSTFVWLVCVVPAIAQDAQQPTPSPTSRNQPATAANPDQQQNPASREQGATVPNADQQHNDVPSTQFVEDALRTRLARAGFSDIEMMPTSFLVRAKDANGNPVMLVLSPDSVTELKQGAPQNGQDHTTGSSAPQAQQKF
jgi:hypothetical protein